MGRREFSVIDLQNGGVLLVEDGNHGEYRPRRDEFGNVGTSFIRAADLANGRVLFESAQKVSDDAMRRIRKGVGAGGDVILSHKGTVGKVAFVPLGAPPFVCSPQTTFWRTLDNDRLDRRYLYAFLNSRQFHNQLYSRANETDMAGYVSLTAQRMLNVVLPPISEQRVIASILGSLDDKIELNRRMNETLEGIARALFKSWFVDFDPVRAKMDGRQPAGMRAEVAELFPGEFEQVNGELVPKGWRLGRLDDLVVLQRGFDLPKKDRTQGTFPVIAAGGIHGTHVERKVAGPGVVTGRSGVLGKIYFVHEDFWPLNTTLWIKEYRASRPIHAFHFLRTIGLEAFNAGSAVPTLNRNHVHGLPVIVPRIEIVEKFEEVTKPIFAAISQNARQSDALASLRDTLLPKLLSGELRVPDVGCIAEEVA